MKKVFAVLILILLTGCGSKNYTECKIDFESKELGYTINSNYKIYSKKGFVTKIEKEEEYISSNKEMIKYLYDAKEIEYSNLNSNYGGFTYAINLSGEKITINTIIDFSSVDLKKMVKDNYLSDYYVNKDKLSVGGIKDFYKSKGAICEK